MNDVSDLIFLILFFFFILFEVRQFFVLRSNRQYMHPKVLEKIQAEDKKPYIVFQRYHVLFILSFLLFVVLSYFEIEKIYRYISGILLLFMVCKTYSSYSKLTRRKKEKIKREVIDEGEW